MDWRLVLRTTRAIGQAISDGINGLILIFFLGASALFYIGLIIGLPIWLIMYFT